MANNFNPGDKVMVNTFKTFVDRNGAACGIATGSIGKIPDWYGPIVKDRYDCVPVKFDFFDNPRNKSGCCWYAPEALDKLPMFPSGGHAKVDVSDNYRDDEHKYEIKFGYLVPQCAGNVPYIKDVKFNGPATIVFWEDGTKTVVKCSNKDVFDPAVGISMAVVKKIYGAKPDYAFKKWLRPQYRKIDEWDDPVLSSPIDRDTLRTLGDNFRKGVADALKSVSAIRLHE